MKGLSAYSKLGVSTLRRYISKDGLPYFRLGKDGNVGRVLVKRSEFDNWMERYRANNYLDPGAVADDIIKSLSDE